MTKATSLLEFSAEAPMQAHCKICALPKEIREQIDLMVREGHTVAQGGTVSSSVVVRWIREVTGSTVSRSSVQRHQADHV